MPIIEQFETKDMIYYIALSFGTNYNIGSALKKTAEKYGIDSECGSYHPSKESAYKHFNDLKRKYGVDVEEQLTVFDFI